MIKGGENGKVNENFKKNNLKFEYGMRGGRETSENFYKNSENYHKFIEYLMNVQACFYRKSGGKVPPEMTTNGWFWLFFANI